MESKNMRNNYMNADLEDFKWMGFNSKILFYHLSCFERLISMNRDQDSNMSIDKVSNVLHNVKWKLDSDISSMQYSETGKMKSNSQMQKMCLRSLRT